MRHSRNFWIWMVGAALCLPGLTRAATITSSQSGNWGSTSTWTGGAVPSQNDSVIVQTGDTVIIEASGKSCYHLTIEAGGKLYANKSTIGSTLRYINVFGNITCDGRIGNGSVYDIISFNTEGAACMISGSGIFDAARIRKNDNVNPSTTVTVYMNIILRYGGTVLYNNKSGTVFTFVVNAGDTVSVPGDGTTPGDVAVDGINGAGSTTGGGSIQVSGSMIISGVLYLTTNNSSSPVSVSINSGGSVFAGSASCPNSGAGGHTFTIAGNGLLNLTAGDWGAIGATNNTYIFNAGSSMEFSSAAGQTVGIPAEYHHLTISGGGMKTIRQSTTIHGNLLVTDSAHCVLDTNIQVTANGTCTLSAVESLIMKSPLHSGPTSSFINLGTVSGTGTVKIERYVTKYDNPGDMKFHAISSPVIQQPIQPEFVADPPDPAVDFYRWDEPAGTWINSKDATGLWNTGFQPGDDRTFHTGTGYLAAYPVNVLKSFTGQLHSGDISGAISFTSGDFCGFNLVGNPFSSALNGNIPNWPKTNVDNAVWVWNGETGNYMTWNGVAGTLEAGIIPAIQGFFVRANGPSPALTIPSASRIHSGQNFYKQSTSNLLCMEVSRDRFRDGIFIHYADSAVPGFDPEFDVVKMFGSPEAPQLYSMDSDLNLSIDRVPMGNSQADVPLGFITETEGIYVFEFSGIESFPPSQEIYLVDQLENYTADLRTEPVYTFESGPSYPEDRFLIRFIRPTGEYIPNPLAHISVTCNGATIRIIGLQEEDQPMKVTLVNVLGQFLFSRPVDYYTPEIETDLPGGCYILTLQKGTNCLIKKIQLYKTNS